MRSSSSAFAKGTPAAIILGASHTGTARWLGTIESLAGADIDSELAGIVVVGDVVSLATKIVNEHDVAAPAAVRLS